jgi:hypothetical protein
MRPLTLSASINPSVKWVKINDQQSYNLYVSFYFFSFTFAITSHVLD